MKVLNSLFALTKRRRRNVSQTLVIPIRRPNPYLRLDDRLSFNLCSL